MRENQIRRWLAARERAFQVEALAQVTPDDQGLRSNYVRVVDAAITMVMPVHTFPQGHNPCIARADKYPTRARRVQ